MADAVRQRAFHEAARSALTRFPVQPESVDLVSISENVTFRVSERGGDGIFALRLHRPGYNSLRELESERMWTSALADAGIRVQEPLVTLEGDGFCAVPIPPENEERFAGMTRWMPGIPLSSTLARKVSARARRAAYRAIGRLAAGLHSQASRWNLPRGFTRPALDTDGLLGEEPRWGRFWEHTALGPAERDLLLDARRELAARLRAFGRDARRFGLIHADLHAENVIVHGDRVGIIDFDDAAFGWHLYDLATALIEQSFKEDFEALRGELLAGYREVRPLSAEDGAMLDTFLLLRGMALIGWYHQRPEHVEAEYFEEIRERVLRQCRELLRA